MVLTAVVFISGLECSIRDAAIGDGIHTAGVVDMADMVCGAHARAPCYSETFTPRNLKFYERPGFYGVADHLEPTTNKEYIVMRRDA